jgi:hypothetical protein
MNAEELFNMFFSEGPGMGFGGGPFGGGPGMVSLSIPHVKNGNLNKAQFSPRLSVLVDSAHHECVTCGRNRIVRVAIKPTHSQAQFSSSCFRC